jgi:hypothetical protein
MYFIGAHYYEGDRVSPDDIEVTQRPSINHDWDGEEWVLNVEKDLIDQIAVIDKQLADLDSGMYRNRGTREQDLITAPYIAQQLYGLTEPQLYASSREYKKVKDAELVTAPALRAAREVLDDQLDAL